MTYVPADKSDLKAGAQIIAFIKKLPDGSLETNRISVGRDGIDAADVRWRLSLKGLRNSSAAAGFPVGGPRQFSWEGL